LFGCYKTLLEHALSARGDISVSRIPDVELYLEIGASNKTTISFISLGLSRAVAISLSGARGEFESELEIEEALTWLQSHSENLGSLRLSPLQIREVLKLLETIKARRQN
ncbi:MAG TPA: hypothetical protein VK522_08325, partial [Pseudolabrys sp.]|nr:hypothetical protein [Pseudolabrys sp.]